MGAQKVWKPVWLDNKKSRQMVFMHLSFFITTVTINNIIVNKLIVRILGTNRSPKSVEAIAVSTVLFGLTTKSPDKWHSCMLLDETLLRSAGVFLLCEPG